jgi:Uma2 family endonuclease
MANIVRGEIVLPETKPETEWLRGRAVRKMSPQWDHAALQRWWLLRLYAWSQGRGEVGAEWRFRIAPPGEEIRPLVPDVSYLSYERMGDATQEEIQAPLVPPDVAVEIRSPGDSRADLEDKIAVLLRAGTDVVIVVNPRTRTVVTWRTTVKRIFSWWETFEDPALPGFRFALKEMFDTLIVRRPNRPSPPG